MPTRDIEALVTAIQLTCMGLMFIGILGALACAILRVNADAEEMANPDED